MSVQEGDVAPDFEMPASGGRTGALERAAMMDFSSRSQPADGSAGN